MKKYQFHIIRTHENGDRYGLQQGFYYAGGSRIHTATGRALKQYEKQHGQTSKQLFLQIYVREVRA